MVYQIDQCNDETNTNNNKHGSIVNEYYTNIPIIYTISTDRL